MPESLSTTSSNTSLPLAQVLPYLWPKFQPPTHACLKSFLVIALVQMPSLQRLDLGNLFEARSTGVVALGLCPFLSSLRFGNCVLDQPVQGIGPVHDSSIGREDFFGGSSAGSGNGSGSENSAGAGSGRVQQQQQQQQQPLGSSSDVASTYVRQEERSPSLFGSLRELQVGVYVCVCAHVCK